MIIVANEHERHTAWLRQLDEQCARERDRDMLLAAMLSDNDATHDEDGA